MVLCVGQNHLSVEILSALLDDFLPVLVSVSLLLRSCMSSSSSSSGLEPWSHSLSLQVLIFQVLVHNRWIEYYRRPNISVQVSIDENRTQSHTSILRPTVPLANNQWEIGPDDGVPSPDEGDIYRHGFSRALVEKQRCFGRRSSNPGANITKSEVGDVPPFMAPSKFACPGPLSDYPFHSKLEGEQDMGYFRSSVTSYEFLD